jgi:hypothetical protein
MVSTLRGVADSEVGNAAMGTIGQLVDAVESLEDVAIIYALEPWTMDSEACVYFLDDLPERDNVVVNGARYLLEANLIVEVLEGTFGPEWRSVPLVDRCNRVIEYAINDA